MLQGKEVSDSAYDTALSGLETLGEILGKSSTGARELIKQVAIDQKLSPGKLKDIATGEYHYPAREFREDVYQALGFDRDVEEDWPEWLKTGADVATEFISLDSLLFMPGKLAKPAVEAMKGTRLASTRLSKYLNKTDPKTLGRLTTGSVLGAMAVDEDDEAKDIAKKMLMGAGVVGGGLALGKGFNIARKQGDLLLDVANEALRPGVHEAMQRLLPNIEKTGFGDKVGVNDLIRESIANKTNLNLIKNDYLHSIIKPEAGLTAKGIEIYDQIRVGAAALSTSERKRLLKQVTTKLETDGIKVNGHVKQELLKQATRKMNSNVGRNVLRTMEDMDAPKEIYKAINEFVDHNRKAIKNYNKVTGDEMVAWDFYMPSKGMVKEATEESTKLNTVKSGFRMMKKGEIDFDKLTRGQVRELTAERYTTGFMSSTEKTAQMLLRKMNDTPINAPGFMSKILNIYDGMTRHIVTQHLFMHHSWLVNNYADNVLRAYMGIKKAGGSTPKALATATESAVAGAYGTIKGIPRVLSEATTGRSMDWSTGPGKAIGRALDYAKRFNKTGTFDALLDSTHPIKGSGNAMFDSDIIQLSNITGVVDSAKARDMFMHLDNTGNIRNFKGIAEVPKTDLEQITSFFHETVGRLGTTLEGDTRMRTFKGVIDSLLADSAKKVIYRKDIGLLKAYKAGIIRTSEGPVDVRSVVDKAVKIIDDVFFDYNDVTNFERKVMKRIAPYYTFAAKNTKFWFDVMTDPDMVQASNQTFRSLDAIGRTPTKEERRKIPGYLLEEGTKVLGKDKKGRMILSAFPSMSQREAIKEVLGAVSAVAPIESDNPWKIANKLNPMIRAGAELVLNKDFFSGKKVLGSKDDPLKRKVYNDAILTQSIFNRVPLFNVDVIEDDRGGLWVKDNESSFWVTVRKNLFPLRLPETMVGAYRDVQTGKRTPTQAALQYLTPLKVKTLSKKDEQYAKARKKRAYNKRKKIEKEIQKSRSKK